MVSRSRWHAIGTLLTGVTSTAGTGATFGFALRIVRADSGAAQGSKRLSASLVWPGGAAHLHCGAVQDVAGSLRLCRVVCPQSLRVARIVQG